MNLKVQKSFLQERIPDSVLVCISYNSQKEAFTFYVDMSMEEIFAKILGRFGLGLRNPEDFVLKIPTLGCCVKSYEHFRENQSLILQTKKKVISQIQSSKNSLFYHEEAEEESESSEIMEIIPNKSILKKSFFNDFEDQEISDLFDEDYQGVQPKDEPHSNQETEQKHDEISLIDIIDISNITFDDRVHLHDQILDWSHKNGFKLKFKTREQTLTTGTKVSILQCSKKECNFFLEFRTNVENKIKGKYALTNSCNKHNHKLFPKDDASQITQEIITRLTFLRKIGVEIKRIVAIINEEFKKKFQDHIIRYQLEKIKDTFVGKPLDDAQALVDMLMVDAEQRGTFWCAQKNKENQLEHFCFMTPYMKNLTKYFSDVLVIDTSHKTNRFGMPFLDIVLVNNHGKTCLCFVALLKNQQYESFMWALTKFKANLEKDPMVIFSDEEEALRKGTFIYLNSKTLAIKQIFPSSTNFLCSWHVEQNLKKRALYWNKKLRNDSKNATLEKKKLYKTVINLPHSNYEDDYISNYKAIIGSKYVDSTFKDYLKKRHIDRQAWVKCYMKNKFTCGMSTTSRIESKHRQLKRYLNDTTRLSEIFVIINEVEEDEIFDFQNESQKIPKNDSIGLNQNLLIKACYEIYPEYIVKKFKQNFVIGTNYNVILKQRQKW